MDGAQLGKRNRNMRGLIIIWRVGGSFSVMWEELFSKRVHIILNLANFIQIIKSTNRQHFIKIETL